MSARKTVTKRAARAITTKKKAVAKRKVAKPASKKKVVARRKSPAKAPGGRSGVKKTTIAKAALGRPRVAGTAELDLMFRNDREAREICEFLGVKTLKELEVLSPDEIVDRLTAPVVRTVGRIRKALAMNNRCLAGDQKFAVAFKKELC